jgi:hypothetical protein
MGWPRAALLAVLLVLGRAGGALAGAEEAVIPPEQYDSPKARSLAARYRDQLVQFYEQIYHCMPWLGVRHGIGFRQPRGVQADERYLSIWISVDQQDDGRFAAMPQERRVSAMFSRYGVDLLRRMASLGDLAADANVSGFGVVLSWLKPGTDRPGRQPVSETLALFADKSTLLDFLAKKLPAAEFANRARFTVFEGEEAVGRLPLDVWEDSFNSTFKLPNYEPPKGQKC